MILEINPLSKFRYCPCCGAESFADHESRGKHCSRCGLTYYHNVACAVACLIRDGAGRYLFVVRDREPAKGTLDLPGGFVDPCETVEEAVMREIKEETGLDIAQSQIYYLTSRPNIYPYSGIDVYTSDLFFVVEVEHFCDAQAADDAAALVVSPLQEVDAEDFGLQSIRGLMSEILSGRLSMPQSIFSRPLDK